MLDLGGLFYWWRRVIDQHTPLIEVPAVDLQPHNLIQNSPVYLSKTNRLYGVKITEPTDDGSCFLYRIFQLTSVNGHQDWERIGSIQVMNEDSAIWVRWGLISHSIRLFDKQELSKLLQVLEKASLKLGQECLQDFSQKRTLAAFY